MTNISGYTNAKIICSDQVIHGSIKWKDGLISSICETTMRLWKIATGIILRQDLLNCTPTILRGICSRALA